MLSFVTYGQGWGVLVDSVAGLLVGFCPVVGAFPAFPLKDHNLTQSEIMGFNLGELMIDEDVSKSGVWVDYLGGSRIKLASSSSHKYKAAVARLYKQNRLQLDDTNPNNYRLIQEITAEALSSMVLLDWEGINWPNPDGTVTENIPYTKELGKAALLGADQFREFVNDKASTPSLFKKAVVEEAVGN